ncbi:MAG: HNH endonuclease [Pirellulaceae bacterium]
MSSRPSAELRRQVVERACNRCEYCLIHQDDGVAAHQIDHVMAEKHGGETTLANLALSERRELTAAGRLPPRDASG